jgi:hypothetical protein
VTGIEILDPSIDRRRWVPARRGRLLLAACVDLLIFSVPWAYFVAVTDRLVPGFAAQPFFVRYIAFAIVELIVLNQTSLSPGARLLGIRFVAAKSGQSRVDVLWRNRIPFVDRDLQRSESWLSILVGLWLLLDASKALVRWTMFSPPLPLFGIQTAGLGGVLTSLTIGAVETYIACLVLRMRPRALMLGAPFYGLLAVSAAVSWKLWDDWAARYVVARRAYEGLPVRPGEIESLQSMSPELVIIGMAFNGALILLLTKHFLPIGDGDPRG